jgi:hypothetical protein
MRKLLLPTLGVVVAASFCMPWLGFFGAKAAPAEITRRAVLNRLRDEINALYGFDANGTPRINCGPCARFAILLRDQCRGRFGQVLNIACVMSPDGTECGHVLLKFPDGSYYDGGNGVVSDEQVLARYAHCSIEEMAVFDRQLLDERVGGLNHDHYPLCPNYSDATSARLIERHLALIPVN